MAELISNMAHTTEADTKSYTEHTTEAILTSKMEDTTEVEFTSNMEHTTEADTISYTEHTTEAILTSKMEDTTEAEFTSNMEHTTEAQHITNVEPTKKRKETINNKYTTISNGDHMTSVQKSEVLKQSTNKENVDNTTQESHTNMFKDSTQATKLYFPTTLLPEITTSLTNETSNKPLVPLRPNSPSTTVKLTPHGPIYDTRGGEGLRINSVAAATPLIVVSMTAFFVLLTAILLLVLCCCRKFKASKDSYSTAGRRQGTNEEHDIPTTIHEASTLPMRSRRPRAQPFEIIQAYDNNAYSTYPRTPVGVSTNPEGYGWYKQQPPVIKYRDTALLPPRIPTYDQQSRNNATPVAAKQPGHRNRSARPPIPTMLVPPKHADYPVGYIRTLPSRNQVSRSNSFPDRISEDLRYPSKDDLHKGRMTLSTGLTDSRSKMNEDYPSQGMLRASTSGSLYLDNSITRNNQSLC